MKGFNIRVPSIVRSATAFYGVVMYERGDEFYSWSLEADWKDSVSSDDS
jgi:hypothetical protein